MHQTAACCINISQFKKLSCATAVTCNHYFAALQTTVVASTTASQRSSPAPPRIVFFKSMHVPHLFVWTLQVLSLWLHETCRVFEDRLTCQEDHDWFRWGSSQLRSVTLLRCLGVHGWVCQGVHGRVRTLLVQLSKFTTKHVLCMRTLAVQACMHTLVVQAWGKL